MQIYVNIMQMKTVLYVELPIGYRRSGMAPLTGANITYKFYSLINHMQYYNSSKPNFQ